jgi:hypothetical protein
MVPLDSTSFKDSNDTLFAIFGSTELKIWFLQDADQIWFQTSNSKIVWTREWHLAVSYWLVPVRVDHASGALD